MRRPLLALAVLAFGCKTAAPVPTGPAPEIPLQELRVVTQSLTEFALALKAQAVAPDGAVAQAASWELVVDGRVVKSGELPLNHTFANGAPFDFEVRADGQYVSSADELKAMDTRGGSLLMALRGDVRVKVGEHVQQVPFARSRVVRTPRLPMMKLHELEAARFSENEAQATFHLGVFNPNPFELRVTRIQWAISVAGKPVGEGVIGKGERVNPSSTGVFDVEVKVDEATHGKDVVKLIKGLNLAYVAKGQLDTELYTEPYEFTGTIKLNVSK